MDRFSGRSGSKRNPPSRRYGSFDRFSLHGRRNQATDPNLERLLVLGKMLLAAIFGVATFALYRILPHLFTTLDANIQDKWLLGLLVGTGTLLAGFGLYYVRKHWRLQYALLEIAFAFTTAWVAMGRIHTQGDLGIWVALSASAYLVVRGLDNLKTAREKKNSSASPEKPNNGMHPTPLQHASHES
jgi:hypothetical protein